MSQSDEELYRNNIDYRLKPVVQKIIEDAFSYISQWNCIKISAALHHYTSTKVKYETRGPGPNRRRFRPPTEVWYKGGNCEEQTVLIASLFASVKGIKSMLVSVEDGKNNYHLFPLVGYDTNSSKIQVDLREFYKSDINFTRNLTSGFSWINKEGLAWFIADPEFSYYIGDVKDLSSDGYILTNRNGWDWNNKVYEIML